MAKANEQPTLDVQAGAVAFSRNTPRVLAVLGAAWIEALGWTRPNKFTLLIPISGVHDNTQDDYLLRLGFQAYRRWPPSAQFVDPQTQTYRHPQDRHFIPKLTSQECHSHADYQKPGGGTLQLICCSATLEFYEVAHSVEAHFLWRDTDTFYTTLHAIRKAFASLTQGRFPPYGK